MIRKVCIFLFFLALFVVNDIQATSYMVLPVEKPDFKIKREVKSNNNHDGVERVNKFENKNHDGVVRVKQLEKIDDNIEITENKEELIDNKIIDNKIIDNNIIDNKIIENKTTKNKEIVKNTVDLANNISKNKNNINSSKGKTKNDNKNLKEKINTKKIDIKDKKENKKNINTNRISNIAKLNINNPVVITTNTGDNKVINTTNTVIIDINTTTKGKENIIDDKNSNNNGKINNNNSDKINGNDKINNNTENIEINEIEIINDKNKLASATTLNPETIEIKVSGSEIEAIRLNSAKSSGEPNNINLNTSNTEKIASNNKNLFELPKLTDKKEKIKATNDKNNNVKTQHPTTIINKNNASNNGENETKENETNRSRQVISTEITDKRIDQSKKSKINTNNIKNNNYRKNYSEINNKNYNKINNNEYNIIPKTQIVKSSNYSNYTSNQPNNLKIINKIEQNLMYSDNLNSKVKIDIKKGEWTKEDLIETEADETGIEKTSKKIEAKSTENERDVTIAKLKDLAYEATKMKEYEIAVKLYKEVLRLNKKDNFAKLSLATSYHMLGQYVQAKPIYIELLPIFPNSEQLASNLLSIIIQESPYEAIYLLPALASKYNTSAKIQAQTSVAFTSVERYDTAIKYIQKAINLDEGNYEYKYNLAVLYDLTKRYSQAYSLYKELYDISQVEKSLPSRKIKERLTQLKKYI